MFEVDDIRDWRDHDVVDSDGAKIGTIEAVYLDTATEEPVFASVQIGIVGRHKLTFVPLAGARVAPKHLRVMADKEAGQGRTGHRHRRRTDRGRTRPVRPLRDRLHPRSQR